MEAYRLTTMMLIYIGLTTLTTWCQVVDQCIIHKKGHSTKKAKPVKLKKIKILKNKKNFTPVNFCDVPDATEQKTEAEDEKK